jgi:hypothetical protein
MGQSVDRDGDLPQNEGVRVNAFERMLLLFVSDQFFEAANRFMAASFDLKYIARAIALNQTVEFKGARHDYRKIEVMVGLNCTYQFSGLAGWERRSTP